MKVDVRTRGERPIPWPDDLPPTRGDQVFHGGELYDVGQVRWDLSAGVCRVTLEPVGAMFDADARSR